MGKPRDTKITILPSTTRKGTTLSTSAALDSPSVISKLVSPPQASNAGTSAESENSSYNCDDASAVLDNDGSLGSFLDATIARSRQIENTETPNENAATPVNSPESVEYSSDDLDEYYVELDDDFIEKCNATTDARKIKKLLAEHAEKNSDAEELLAKIGRNHDDWSTPEPTPTPIVKKRGMIKLNDEDMREAKKSLKEKGIKPEDVKNLPPIEDLCEITPPSSMIEYMKDIVSNKRKIPNEEISTMLANYSFNGKIPKKLGDQDFEFHRSQTNPMVRYKIYNKTINLPFSDFCAAIRVPRWGSCEKVRGTPRELSNLYTMICNGRSFSDDGGKISSIQQPAIRYFAYFVTKCVLARRNAIRLPAPALLNLDARKGWSITENELNAYIERESHRAREGMEEAEEHPDSSSDAASSSYQHYGHVEPPRHSSAQGPYYHSMYDPPAWNSDPRWE
ncbi:hypothetical protein QYE76_042565 [Lolium multiflorum]|uniref:Arabidopsis retrotransposon Orf1 C-terminal domain-containing protein n=1 Tax=Lolium multiflorum TaxID=4521 RepID=A0AAD8TH33_LOLMU|nr:hypothetical protein QYE76_042565 [Lolium multiflorum]